jgi:hypothetical protein
MAKKVGRPQKNTVDFFPHLVGDARMIRRLKRHYGKDGYIVYWVTMEALAKSDGHYLNLSDENDLEDHADDCMVEVETLEQILDDLSKYGRIDSELWEGAKMIWCEKFIKQIEHVYIYTRNRPAPEKPQIEPETNFLPENNNLIAISRRDSRVDKEESRGEESREEKEKKSENSFLPEILVRNESQEITTAFDHEARWAEFCKAFPCPDIHGVQKELQNYVRVVTQFAMKHGGGYDETAAGINQRCKDYAAYKNDSGETRHNPSKWLIAGEFEKEWAKKPRPQKNGKGGYTQEESRIMGQIANMATNGDLNEYYKNYKYEDDDTTTT